MWSPFSVTVLVVVLKVSLRPPHPLSLAPPLSGCGHLSAGSSSEASELTGLVNEE